MFEVVITNIHLNLQQQAGHMGLQIIKGKKKMLQEKFCWFMNPHSYNACHGM